MITISKEVKVGLIITSAIIAAIWGINFLKGRDIFSRTKEYKVIYEQVNGLAKSNIIKLNGFKIGQVEKIVFLPDNTGKILVTLSVNSSVFISEDAKAIIANADFLGTKEIQIVLGSSKMAAKDGAELKGEMQVGLMEAIGNQAGPVKDKFENLLLSMDTLAKNLNAALNTENKRNLSSGLASLSATLKHFEHISASLDEMSTGRNGSINATMDNLSSISRNLKENNDKIDNIVENISSVSDSLAAANLKSAIDNLNKNMAEFAVILQKINNGEGSLGALLKDDKLYTNLNNSAAHLDSLLIDVKANPKHYVRFSVFGKK